MVNKKEDPKKATAMFRAGKRKALGGKTFATIPEAVKAAKARSKRGR